MFQNSCVLLYTNALCLKYTDQTTIVLATKERTTGTSSFSFNKISSPHKDLIGITGHRIHSQIEAEVTRKTEKYKLLYRRTLGTESD